MKNLFAQPFSQATYPAQKPKYVLHCLIHTFNNSMLFLAKSFFISEFGYESTKWLLEQRSVVGIGTECPEIELTQKGTLYISGQ